MIFFLKFMNIFKFLNFYKLMNFFWIRGLPFQIPWTFSKFMSFCQSYELFLKKVNVQPVDRPTGNFLFATRCGKLSPQRTGRARYRAIRAGPFRNPGKPFCFRFWECSTGFQLVYSGIAALLEDPEPSFIFFLFYFFISLDSGWFFFGNNLIFRGSNNRGVHATLC